MQKHQLHFGFVSARVHPSTGGLRWRLRSGIWHAAMEKVTNQETGSDSAPLWEEEPEEKITAAGGGRRQGAMSYWELFRDQQHVV